MEKRQKKRSEGCGVQAVQWVRGLWFDNDMTQDANITPHDREVQPFLFLRCRYLIASVLYTCFQHWTTRRVQRLGAKMHRTFHTYLPSREGTLFNLAATGELAIDAMSPHPKHPNVDMSAAAVGFNFVRPRKIRAGISADANSLE